MIGTRGLFGALGVERFLAEYWQKRPLLLRGSLPDFEDPLGIEDLLALAADPAMETRVVVEHGETPWELSLGPLTAERRAALPERDWTVLVQDVDKVHAGVARLLELVSFAPAWRVDDVMVSYAAPGGSVGPHVDQYDVFLVQGRGRRRWQIAEEFDPACIGGADLQVLERFAPEQDWTVGPGDVLYVPPGVAHYGRAVEACVTYSIGFRAPSTVDLLSLCADHALASDTTPRRFVDSSPEVRAERYLMTAEDVSALSHLAETGVAQHLQHALLAHLTTPKDDEPWTPGSTELEDPPSAALRLELGVSRVYIVGKSEILFSCHGAVWQLPLELHEAIRALCETRAEPETVRAGWRHAAWRRLVGQLLEAGLAARDVGR